MTTKSASQSEADTWFHVLRTAHKGGDRDLELLAKRELKNLGYDVVVRRDASIKRQEATQR